MRFIVFLLFTHLEQDQLVVVQMLSQPISGDNHRFIELASCGCRRNTLARSEPHQRYRDCEAD
jgi:hypothetical protein